jgi:hypothetical protein
MRPLPPAVRRWLLAVPAVVGLVVAALTESDAALVVGGTCAVAWSWQTDRARDDSTSRGAS